jgi:Ca-activated chloride channel family protein
VQTNLKIDHELLAIENEHSVSGMLELIAPDAPTGTRLPLHIALVIDRSGSMSGEKLDAAKDAARFLVQRLGADDRLAIVTFDDDVDLVLPLGPVETATAEQAIASIHCGGSTNLSGGWLKGIEELGRGADTDALRRVLLLTDGQANCGITDRDQLVSLANGTKAQTATTTIGFGAGFDEDLLQQIADGAGGASYYVESPEDAPGVFAEEFEGLASIVAQNLSVEIVAGDDVKLLGVLNEYPIADVPNGLHVQLGDVFGGDRRRIVFQMLVPGVAELGVKRIAELTVRYVETGKQIAQHEISVPVTVNLVSADEAAAAEADHEVVEQVTILMAARARKEAREFADRGDYDGAAERLRPYAMELRALGSPAATLEAELLEEHIGGFGARTYDSSMRKRMTNEAYRSSRGRPNKKKDN